MQIEHSCRRKDRRDDAHGLLCIIASMAQGISRCGKKLSATKCFIDLRWRPTVKYPIHCDHQDKPDDEADYRRGDNKRDGLDPALGLQQTTEPSISGDRRAAITTNQRMRT